MVKVGLVGAGPWAGMFTGPMIAAAPGLELSGIWARRSDAALVLADRFGATVAPSFEALLDGCEVIAFNVPPDVQAELAPRAARAGKHLLLEKPLAFTVAGAEAIHLAALDAGVSTQLMLTYRFTPAVRLFLEAVQKAPVRHIRTGWIGGSGLSGSPFASGWRLGAGAVLFDLGPHALDLAEAAAGPIVEVRAKESGGVVVIDTEHHGGALGQVALSQTTPDAEGPLEGTAVTDAGRFVLSDPTPDPPDEVQRTIATEFRRTIAGEIEQPLDAYRGVQIQRVLAAAAESLRTGRPVTL